MFDIGFWEIIVIAVIALIVVGPDEFPVLVQSIGRGIGKARRFLTSVKHDLDYEIERASEVKRLMEEEARIAEMHRQLESEAAGHAVPKREAPAQPVQSTQNKVEDGDKAEKTEADPGPAQPVGDRQPDKRAG